MSGWWSVDGEDLRNTSASDDLPSNSGFAPLPNNTKVLAIVDSAGIGEKDGNRYAEATLTILKPEGYANRKLFPRFWIYDDNPSAADAKKKRDNDMRRFVKLDASCGGKLAKSGKIPTDDDIALAMTGKQIIVNVMLMEPKDGKEPFNWYSDYWPKGAKELSEAPARSAPKRQTQNASAFDDLDDSDVPF